jgi:hypothetical protein
MSHPIFCITQAAPVCTVNIVKTFLFNEKVSGCLMDEIDFGVASKDKQAA